MNRIFMSIKVMNRVWEQSSAKGSDLLVLLAIADFANDDGYAFPSIATIAKKSRIRPETAGDSIKRLIEAGELEKDVCKGVDFGNGPTNRYLVKINGEGGCFTPGVSNTGGVNQPGNGGCKTPPKPSEEPSKYVLVDIPLILNTPEFKKAFEEWVVYLKQRRMSPSADIQRRHMAKLESYGLEGALQAIPYSIERQYRAPFMPSPEKSPRNGQFRPKAPANRVPVNESNFFSLKGNSHVAN